MRNCTKKTKYNRVTLLDIILSLCTAGLWSFREYYRTNHSKS